MLNIKYYFDEIYGHTKRRAALIPIYIKDEKCYILLMKPSNSEFGGSDFQIAKGMIDKGENAEQAAIREAKEELGYIHKSNYKLKLLWNNKKFKMQYFIIVVDDKKKNKPHFETKESKWFEINEAQKIIRDWQKNIIPMIKRKLGIK